MSVSFSCPECSAAYRVPDEHAGKRTKCKKCGAAMSIPVAGEAPAETLESEESGAVESEAEAPPERRPRPSSSRRTRSGSGGTRRRRGEPEEPAEPALPPAAIGACVGAAVVGGGVWAGIAMGADLEIGWLAWGIGGACGAAMSKLGGRGLAAAVIAAVLAVVGIVGGKAVAAKLAIDQAAEDFANDPDARQDFEDLRDIGEVVAEMEHPLTMDAVRQFAEQFGNEDTSTMTALEVQELRERLLFFESLQKPDGWTRYQERYIADFQTNVGVVEVLKQSADPIDLIFLALGVATAFGLVMRES